MLPFVLAMPLTHAVLYRKVLLSFALLLAFQLSLVRLQAVHFSSHFANGLQGLRDIGFVAVSHQNIRQYIYLPRHRLQRRNTLPPYYQ